MKRKGRIIVVFYAVFIFVTALFIYSKWLSHAYTGDDLQYARDIHQAATGEMLYHPAGGRFYDPQSGGAQTDYYIWDVPINARYILEWPTSILVVKLWQRLGWSGDVIMPILTLRTLVGALGMLLFFLAIQTLCNDTLIAGISSMGLATSHAYWYYSTHLDYTINVTALVCLALYLMALQYRLSNPARSNSAPLVVLAMASFYSLTAGITTLVFALALAFWHPGEKISERIRQFIKLCTVYGVLVAAVIALVIAVWVSPSDLISPDYWKSALYIGRTEYNVDAFNDAIRTVMGFAKAHITHPGWPKSARLFYGPVAVLMSTPFWVLLFRRRQLQPKTRVWAILIVVWLISHSIFNWIYNPSSIKYWPVPRVAWWTIVALTLEHLKLSRQDWYRLAVTSVLIFVALTFFVNLTTKFLPQSDEESNEWLSIAQALRQSEPNALFVSTGHPPVGLPLDFHIIYFARRNVVSTDLASYANGGNEKVVRQIVTSHVERHRSAGGMVYAYGVDTLPLDRRHEFLELLDGQQLKTAWSFPQLMIYEVVPEAGE